MTTTTIRVDVSTRDRLTRLAGGKSMDELLKRLAFEQECRDAARRLADTDPEAWADYETEQVALAEGSMDAVIE